MPQLLVHQRPVLPGRLLAPARQTRHRRYTGSDGRRALTCLDHTPPPEQEAGEAREAGQDAASRHAARSRARPPTGPRTHSAVVVAAGCSAACHTEQLEWRLRTAWKPSACSASLPTGAACGRQRHSRATHEPHTHTHNRAVHTHHHRAAGNTHSPHGVYTSALYIAQQRPHACQAAGLARGWQACPVPCRGCRGLLLYSGRRRWTAKPTGTGGLSPLSLPHPLCSITPAKRARLRRPGAG